MSKWLYNFVSGIIIGTCMILPGVSGSIVAIMLGIYEEVIYLINKNNSNIYKIKKLFPIALGLFIGVFVFGKILLVFYNKYTFYMMYAFMGLMLGSIPILKREVTQKNQKISIKILFMTLCSSTLLFLLPKIFNFKISNKLNCINLFIGGILYISGKIIPGISSSFFLMILGLYDYLLEIIVNPFNITLPKIISLIPFTLGVLFGFIVLIKLINYLLNNYFSKTYSGIIGFILGSVLSIYPGMGCSFNYLYALILMVISYELVNKLSKKCQKK